MTKISKKDFIACVIKSQIVDRDALEQSLESDQSPTAEKLATKLIREGLLTRWQAKSLLLGRTKLQIGSYTLLQRTKRDELGDRFDAIHTSLARKVEIQVLPATLTADEKHRAEFLNIAGKAAKLDHPNLMHVFDIDHEGGRFYLITEHTPNSPLGEIDSQRLTPVLVAEIVNDAIAGVEHAHQHQVIHGALSANEMVLADDGVTKILNLPLAPVRQHVAGKNDSLQPEDDFTAIGSIGTSLLKNVSSAPQPQIDTLSKILVQLASGKPESIAPSKNALSKFIAAHRVTKPEPFDFSDEPIPEHTGKPLPKNTAKTQTDNSGSTDKTPSRSPMMAWWENNPVSVFATALVVGLLVGGGGWFAFLSWNKTATPARPTLSQTGDTSEMKKPAANPVAKKMDVPDIKDVKAMEELIAQKIEDGPPVTDNKKPKIPVRQKEPETKLQQPPPKKSEPTVALKPELPQPTTDNNNVVLKTDPEKQKQTFKPEPQTNQPPKFEPLKRIYGIGDATQRALYEAGITTFSQLAAMSPDQIKDVLKKASFSRLDSKQYDNWIADAKKFAGNPPTTPASSTGNSTATTTASTATTPQPDAQKPQSPEAFQTFPREVDLPPLDVTDEAKLSDLVIPPGFLLGAELIAEEGISRTKLFFELEQLPRDPKNRTEQKWAVGVKRRPRDKISPVGTFRKSKDAFYFQWQAEAAENRYADYLRNCYLKLFLPNNESKLITLRKPVKIGDLRLTEESLKNQIEIDLPAFPALETLIVDVLPLRIRDVPTNVSVARIEKDQPAVIWLKEQDKTGFLRININGEFRSKIKLQSNLVFEADGRTTPVRDLGKIKEFASTLGAQAYQARVVWEQAEAGYDNVPNGQKTAYRNHLKDLEKDAKSIQAKRDLARQYLETLPKILNQPISVRVYARLGNNTTVLAQTEQTSPTTENKK